MVGFSRGEAMICWCQCVADGPNKKDIYNPTGEVMSGNWLTDLLILNELENRKEGKSGDDGNALGLLILVPIMFFMAMFLAYPATLIMQFRRKDWIPLAITAALLPIGWMVMEPRLKTTEGLGIFFMVSTVGVISLLGYLVYFFCQRWNQRIAKGASWNIGTFYQVLLVILSLAVLFASWGIMNVSYPLLAVIYGWLDYFMDMRFESLPGVTYVYERLAWPLIIGVSFLAITPLAAWFRRRKAEGKRAAPIGIIIAAIPAFPMAMIALKILKDTIFGY